MQARTPTITSKNSVESKDISLYTVANAWEIVTTFIALLQLNMNLIVSDVGQSSTVIESFRSALYIYVER